MQPGRNPCINHVQTHSSKSGNGLEMQCPDWEGSGHHQDAEEPLFPLEMKRVAGFEYTQGKYRGSCQAQFFSSTSLPSLLEVGHCPGTLTEAVGV